jgi:hypothetical protein
MSVDRKARQASGNYTSAVGISSLVKMEKNNPINVIEN